MAIGHVAQPGLSIDEEVIDALRASLLGDLHLPGEEGYDDGRRVWNSMIDKHPAMVVRCHGPADVVEAVNFARDHDIELAVKGGGHNVAGNAVNDDGLVIDLSPMKAVQVDPVRRIARVQGGATWLEFDRETQLHGLTAPGGQVSSTGVAGLTLAGGLDITRRKWGLACDNLISVEVVTANGEIVVANERENDDLFWAIRGGGGNFGVVTWFEFQLHPLGPDIYAVATMYPMEAAQDVMRAWRAFHAQAPDEITADIALWNVLPIPGIDPELIDMPVVTVLGFYAGPAEEGALALQPMREFHDPVVDISQAWNLAELHSAFDAVFPDTKRNYWKSLSFPELTDEVIDTLIEIRTDQPTPRTPMGLRGLGGAMSRIPEDATAYGNRDALYNLSIDSSWDDPAEDEQMIAWTRDTWSKVHELTGGGVYLNFAGLGEDNDNLARGAYGRNYARLQKVKQRYDPANLFRSNINITPDG